MNPSDPVVRNKSYMIRIAGAPSPQNCPKFVALSDNLSLPEHDAPARPAGSLPTIPNQIVRLSRELLQLNRMTRATGQTFLTATTDDAPALEGYRGHGIFTYALLDALDHADVNKNGLIEVLDLPTTSTRSSRTSPSRHSSCARSLSEISSATTSYSPTRPPS
jgi:hypothetical protein